MFEEVKEPYYYPTVDDVTQTRSIIAQDKRVGYSQEEIVSNIEIGILKTFLVIYVLSSGCIIKFPLLRI